MTKAKKQVKAQATPRTIDQLQGIVTQLTQRLDQHEQILAEDIRTTKDIYDRLSELDEAICPKVAARLTALERNVTTLRDSAWPPQAAPKQLYPCRKDRIVAAAEKYLKIPTNGNLAALYDEVRST